MVFHYQTMLHDVSSSACMRMVRDFDVNVSFGVGELFARPVVWASFSRGGGLHGSLYMR